MRYSTTGVPILPEETDNSSSLIGQQQRAVKWWSRVAVGMACLMMVSGVLNVIGNLLLMFFSDKLTLVRFFDNQGRLVNFKFDFNGLLVLGFAKVLAGVIYLV